MLRPSPARARRPCAGRAVVLSPLAACCAYQPPAGGTAPLGAPGRTVLWTPARMAAARPLELTVGRDGARRRPPRPARRSRHRQLLAGADAGSAALLVERPLFVVQNGEEGFCSATAIDSPTRSLVLTAGHCVNTGPEDGKPGNWSTDLEFVPGFNLGARALRRPSSLEGKPHALRGWTDEGNPDFDLGAFLVAPNAEGVRSPKRSAAAPRSSPTSAASSASKRSATRAAPTRCGTASPGRRARTRSPSPSPARARSASTAAGPRAPAAAAG